MSHWTHVKGKFTLKINSNHKRFTSIYKIIADAPLINGIEDPAVYSIHPLSQFPIREDETEWCWEAEIEIKGDLRGNDLVDTCDDVEAFINYLARIEGTHAHGEITVSEDHRTKVEDRVGVYTFKTYEIDF